MRQAQSPKGTNGREWDVPNSIALSPFGDGPLSQEKARTLRSALLSRRKTFN